MDARIPDLAESLLQGAPAHSLPLLAICQTLARHGGLPAPTLYELALVLRRDARFIVEDPDDPIEPIGVDWSSEVRAAYRAEVRAATLAGTRVRLRPPAEGTEGEDALTLLSGSLEALAERHDPGVSDSVREARAEYQALERALVRRVEA